MTSFFIFFMLLIVFFNYFFFKLISYFLEEKLIYYLITLNNIKLILLFIVYTLFSFLLSFYIAFKISKIWKNVKIFFYNVLWRKYIINKNWNIYFNKKAIIKDIKDWFKKWIFYWIVFVILFSIFEVFINKILWRNYWEISELFKLNSKLEYILVLFLVVLMWFLEEVYFRWFLIWFILKTKNINIKNRKYILFLILFSAAFFAIAHIPQWYSWWTLLNVFIIWIILWYIFVKNYYKHWIIYALFLTSWIHMFNNFLNWLLLIYSSYQNNKQNITKNNCVPNINFVYKYLIKVSEKKDYEQLNDYQKQYYWIYLPLFMLCDNHLKNNKNFCIKEIKNRIEKYKNCKIKADLEELLKQLTKK